MRIEPLFWRRPSELSRSPTRGRRQLLAGGWLVILPLLSSCIAIPVPSRLDSTPGGSIGWKVVMEKWEPDVLVAADRSECVVGRGRFEEVRVGDRVFCQWR